MLLLLVGGLPRSAWALTTVDFDAYSGCYRPKPTLPATGATLAQVVAELPWPACLLLPRTRSESASGDWLITSPLTIPAHITVEIPHGVRLSVGAGVTLTLAASPRAGDYAIFTGDGQVSLSAVTSPVPAEWFGAVGDGTTNDSPALAKLFASLAPHMRLATGKPYVACNLQLSHRVRLDGDGTLKTRSACHIDTPVLTLTDTADDSYVALQVDGNGQESTGVLITGADRVEVHVTGRGLEPLAGCASQSVVRVAGGDGNRLFVIARDLVHNAACANASVPRGASVGGGATNTFITGTFVDSGGTAIVVGESINTLVSAPVIENITDNGIYGVDGCQMLSVVGGSIRNVEEGIVIKCAGALVSGVSVSNVHSNAVSVQDASDVLVNGVYYLDDEGQTDTSHVIFTSRTANVLSTNITIKNSFIRAHFGTGPIPFRFISGTVNNLRFTDNNVSLHWRDTSEGDTVFEHNDGNSLWFERNYIRLIDDTATLTGEEEFRIKVPTVTRWSGIIDNVFITSNAADASLFVQDADQPLFIIRHSGHSRVVNTDQLRQYELNNAAGNRCKVMYGRTAPDQGTFHVCDVVINSEPTVEPSTNCGGDSLIDRWINTASGTPGTWTAIEVCTPPSGGGGGGGGGAPVGASYLVGAANGTLTNEIVAGATPAGELGGSWSAPTVDAIHSGSSHAAIQAAADANAAAALAAHEADTTNVHGIADTSLLGTDANAIHDNVAAEITALVDKAVPVGADHLLIEDSADSNNKKDITLGSIPLAILAGMVTDAQVPNTITVNQSASLTDGPKGDFACTGGNCTISPDSIALTTDTTGDYVAGITTGQGLLKTGTEAATLGLIACTTGQVLKNTGGAWACGADDTGAGGSDSTAIHDDQPSEIVAVADKGTPAAGDHLLIEDSEAGNVKKDITIGSLVLPLTPLLSLSTIPGTVTDTQVPDTITVNQAAELTDGEKGDFTCTTGNCQIIADAVALSTDTTGDYVAGVTTGQGLLKTGTEAATLGLIPCPDGQILKSTGGRPGSARRIL